MKRLTAASVRCTRDEEVNSGVSEVRVLGMKRLTAASVRCTRDEEVNSGVSEVY